MKKEICEHCRGCKVCQLKSKHRPKRAPVVKKPVLTAGKHKEGGHEHRDR